MLIKPKLGALLAAPALALIATAALSIAPAQAAVHAPAHASPTQLAGPHGSLVASAKASPAAYGAIVCGGDVCAQSHNTSDTSQPIYVWANTYTFHGFFDLYECSEFGGCLIYGTTPTETWVAGGEGYCCLYAPDGWTANVQGWEGPYTSGSEWRSVGVDTFGVGGIY